MLHHEGSIGGSESLVDRGVGGIPVDAAPRVVHHLHAGTDQRRVQGLREKVRVSGGDLVALARTVVGRLGVADDARRHQLGTRGDTARELVECHAGGNLRHPGAMPDHVVDGGVVERRINVDQLLRDPPGKGRVAAHDAAVDDAQGYAGTGEALAVRGIRVGERELGVDRRLIRRRWRRWWRRRWGGRRRRRSGWRDRRRLDHAATTTASTQCEGQGSHQGHIASTHSSHVPAAHNRSPASFSTPAASARAQQQYPPGSAYLRTTNVVKNAPICAFRGPSRPFAVGGSALR